MSDGITEGYIMFEEAKTGKAGDNAYSTQADGSYYTSMRMQPKQITYAIGGTTCFNDIAKYLTREKDHKFKLAVKKAIHNVQIERQELSSRQRSAYYATGVDYAAAIDEFASQFKFPVSLVLNTVLVALVERKYTLAEKTLKNFYESLPEDKIINE